MKANPPQGAHVFLDYVNAFFEGEDDYQWLFSMMREAVAQSPATEVHSHLAPFDGSTSPPGFAAVVLIDESHISAHCYADRGLLAVDCFTCGDTDPATIASFLHERLMKRFPNLIRTRMDRVDRFLTEA
ncbi:MAG: S-adenosylmethionine decarboxylase [Poseidonia sp.]